MIRFVCASALLAAGLVACSDPPPLVGAGGLDGGAPGAPRPVATPAAAAAPVALALDLDGGLPPTRISQSEVGESEFVETDRTRDPFRSFATNFLEAAKRPDTNQRKVTLAEYSIDELKPIAIVMASDYPRAMLLDPKRQRLGREEGRLRRPARSGASRRARRHRLPGELARRSHPRRRHRAASRRPSATVGGPADARHSAPHRSRRKAKLNGHIWSPGGRGHRLA